jgi:hypothetical protein
MCSLMFKKGIILTITAATLKIGCFGQINDFKDILTRPVKNKLFKKQNDAIQSERAFLGHIKDRSGKIVFYVAKEFYTVQSAVVRHGHRRIIYFDNNKMLIASYWTDSVLPYKLVNNTLFFKYKNVNPKKRLVHKEPIGPTLPDHICALTNDCYTAEIAEKKHI